MLKFIAYLILFFLVFRWIIRRVLFKAFFVNKKGYSYKGYSNVNNDPVGHIRIKKTKQEDEKNLQDLDKVGEFVEYEEIK